MECEKFKRWPIAVLIICLMAAAGISIAAFINFHKVKPAASTDTYMPLESAKIAEVSDTDLPQGPNHNFKKFFKDDVFVGDSISEGLSYYDFLDDNTVIAEKGLSVNKGVDEADKIIALHPKRIFILFGVNDSDDRTPSSRIVEQYTKFIEKLKATLPNSEIYVTSILPVQESLVKNPHINNKHINECNTGLMAMANQEKVHYVNLASVLNDSNQFLYEGDGIHFKSDFYILWLNYLEDLLK